MAQRLRTLPNLPTLQEQGIKGYECYTWNAILAPAGTPQPIIDKLSDAVQKAMADPAVIKRLQDVGVDPTPGTGPEGNRGLHQGRAGEMGADHQGVGRRGRLRRRPARAGHSHHRCSRFAAWRTLPHLAYSDAMNW